MIRISTPMKDLILIGVLLAMALVFALAKQCSLDAPTSEPIPGAACEVVRPFSEAPDTLMAMMERNQ